jgi:hypothetical protein
MSITRKRIEAEAEATASELVGLFALRAGLATGSPRSAASILATQALCRSAFLAGYLFALCALEPLTLLAEMDLPRLDRTMP